MSKALVQFSASKIEVPIYLVTQNPRPKTEKFLVGKNMSESNSEPERTHEDAAVSPSVKQKAFGQSDKLPSCSGGAARVSVAV